MYRKICIYYRVLCEGPLINTHFNLYLYLYIKYNNNTLYRVYSLFTLILIYSKYSIIPKIEKGEHIAMNYQQAIYEMIQEVQDDRVLRFLYQFLRRIGRTGTR